MKRKILIALGCAVLLGLVAAGAFVAYLFHRGGPIGSTGLKVILQARQSRFPRGEPMRFRVIIQNMSLRRVGGDFDRYTWDIFEVTGPDGKPVPYKECVGQSTAGSPVSLPPLWYLTIRKDEDILENRLILQEGEYSIRVRKQGENMLESNTIRFTVKGGEVPLADEVTVALEKVMPSGWMAARFGYKFELSDFGRWGLVENIGWQVHSQRSLSENRIDVILTKAKIPGAPDSPTKEFPFEYLGESLHGFFYFHVCKKTPESWPRFLEDLKRALGVK